MKVGFMTSLPLLRSGAALNGNRQDAREGGEIPPLPRNCERPCLGRRIGRGRRPAKVVSAYRGDAKQPLEHAIKA